MKTLETKSVLYYNKTSNFSNSNKYLFFQEHQLAFNTLEKYHAELNYEEFEKEAWTDIMFDIDDKKFYAVYGEGSIMSDSDCIYVEVDPNESILKQQYSILAENNPFLTEKSDRLWEEIDNCENKISKEELLNRIKNSKS